VIQASSQGTITNIWKKTETITSINDSLCESEIRKYSSEDSFIYQSSVIKESKSEHKKTKNEFIPSYDLSVHNRGSLAN
jgi:hypothetical protein